MARYRILVVDCKAYGQPDSVLECWKSCFRHKGMDYFTVGGIERLEGSRKEFSVAVVSSAPKLRKAEVAVLKSFVENGGALLVTGPVGSESGLSPAMAALLGIKCSGRVKGEIVSYVEQVIGFYEHGDVLLFLQDKGPIPRISPVSARVLARAQHWRKNTQRYVPGDEPTVVQNRTGKGVAVYCAPAVGDKSRIQAVRAGEGSPGWNSKAKFSVGHPEYSTLEAALKEFMFGLVSLCERPTVRLAHWPNGWRTVASLTGDVHEDAQYVNIQAESGVDMADFLQEEGLDGLFTFSVTAKALEEHLDLLNGLRKRGCEVVPHSTYKSTWLNEIEPERQRAELDRCMEIFRRHLPPECRLGWRSHGWSGNGDTERLLQERGVIWIGNLIAQRYGDFGAMDIHVREGAGTAFVPVPEHPEGLNIVRLPNSYFSPDWVRTMIGRALYGLTAGPSADNAMLEFMKYKFFKDWRLEGLYFVDWHPWEELVAEPIFRKACTELARLFKETEHTAVLQPLDVARWWLFREKMRIHDLRTDSSTVRFKLTLPRNELDLNPTVRLTSTHWSYTGVKIGGKERDWRFYDDDWIALPVDMEGDVEVIASCGVGQDPRLVDSTAVVREARLDGTTMVVEAEETRMHEGKLSIFAPKRSTVTIDGKVQGAYVGYQTFRISKGKHTLLVKADERRITDEELIGRAP